jgi:hypothetical protein
MNFQGVRDSRTQIGRLITRYWPEFVVLAVAVVLWVPRLSGPIDLRWDAGVYYVLGTSLASGQGYRILSEPGSPEALQYPPGLPAIVAMHEWVLGTTDPVVVAPSLRRFNAFVFVAYALAVLALARKYLRPWLALVAAMLCLLQIMTIFLSDLLFTELPFALISVIFALVAADGPFASRPRLRETVSFVLAAAGFLLRTAGLALLMAWVIEALIRRNWRQTLARGILALLPVVLWQAHVQRVRASYEYAHPAYEYQRAPYQFYNVSYAENVSALNTSPLVSRPVHALAARLTANLPELAQGLGETISTSERYWRQLLLHAQQLLFGRRVIPLGLVLVPITGLSVVVAAGVGILVCRRAWLMVGIILASVGLICATPWPDQFERYLMPLAPFLAIAALLALSRLYSALQTSRLPPAIRTAGQLAPAALVMLLLVLQSYAAWQLFYQREGSGVSFVRGVGGLRQHFFYHGKAWGSWEEAVAWIGTHTPPDAIIATPQRHLCYLLANRRAVLPPMESDPARARYLLEAVPVSYVIVDETGEMASFGRRYALPAVQSDSARWHLAHSIYGTRIYERANNSE